MPAIRRLYCHGFSLLELSIALAVIGIVVAGGLSLSSNMVDQQAYVQTGNQMDEIEKALVAFVSINKRLPCPAKSSLSLDNLAFGLEKTNCAAGAPDADMAQVDGLGGRKIWIGGLPVRTLGLRDRYSADEYGNRYSYAVTERHTTQAGYASPLPTDGGAIIIKDGQNTNIIDNAAFIIISHGGDGKGAYRFESASKPIECKKGLDEENCDNTNGIFRDARFNRGSVEANWFDDTTRFMRREMINLMADSSGDAAQLWEENGNHIYNTNAGNVGVGQPNPTAKLDVLGASNLTAGNFTSTGSGTGLRVTSNTGVGIDLTTQFSAQALLINNVSNEAGVSVVTNGNNSDSMRLEHVGSDGFGLKMAIHSPGSSGVSITMPSSEDSAGVRILQENAKTNTSGVDINQEGRGIGLRASIKGVGPNYGVYSNTASESSVAVFGSATGSTSRGVMGEGTLHGVYGRGTANNASGVYGESAFPAGVGVYGRNTAAGGFAVYGYATGSGTTYGVYGHSNSGYGIWCQSALCGGSVGWNAPSDNRLKENVSMLDDTHGLAAIRKLRPVTYTWRDSMRKPLGTQLGFIAQEVEAVLPEVILTGEDQEIELPDGKKETITKAKSMTYEVLTAPLVRAVQQLADQFDALFDSVKKLIARLDGHDADIRALKDENAALKKQNAAFELRLKKLEAASQAAH